MKTLIFYLSISKHAKYLICLQIFRSSPEKSTNHNKPPKVESINDNKNNDQETNNGLNKRQQRQQPMVMVWNTYFPNGKMIPLRQPQPPVYFGPVMGHSNDHQSLPHPTPGHQCPPMSNNHVNHQHPANHQMTDQVSETNFQTMNGLKEEGHQASHSASPLFTQNQLQVVETV